MNTYMDLVSLRKLMFRSFNLEELRGLCFDLSIDYENLSGNTIKDPLIRELIRYCIRTSKLKTLVSVCIDLRPEEDWPNPELPTKSEERPLKLPYLLPQTKVVSFKKLQAILESGNWKEADQETTNMLIRVNRRSTDKVEWLRRKEILQIPCNTITEIDWLWREYSEGKFGLSSQLYIWHQIANPPERFDVDNFLEFGRRVGWYVQDNWLTKYESFYFSINAPIGHLPTLRMIALEKTPGWWGGWRDSFKAFLMRSQECFIG